jgi:regulator of CtrA degradation
MRLTTRLMQIASWLLLQRAVAEGELTPHQARAERHRVRVAAQDPGGHTQFDLLPARLRSLIGLSARLHARILHLDALIAQAEPRRSAPINPVERQRSILESAFGRDG